MILTSKLSRFGIALILICLVRPSLFAGEPSIIRVGLTSSIGKPTSITISCNKPFQIINAPDKATVPSLTGKKVAFSAKGAGIEITTDGASPSSFKGPLRLSSDDEDAVFEIVSPKARYKLYSGILEISGTWSLTVVNELPLEDYVKGVVPAEVPMNFHPEAQKAHVVAIRSYAFMSMSRHKSSGYNLCDSIHCQGFSGVSKIAPWVEKIVDDTRGQVVTYNGKVVVTPYSSDCGGATQSAEDAGMGKSFPYLRSVVDNPSGVQAMAVPEPHVDIWSVPDARWVAHGQSPAASSQPSAASHQPSAISRQKENPKSDDYCSACPVHTWQLTYALDDLDKKFSRSITGKNAVGKFQSMEFTEYDSSGRVKTVLIKGDKGEYKMTGNRFREVFGLDVVKSTRMTLTLTQDGKYRIDGKGYGHGIGLCSFGANGLAKSSKDVTYVDILKHYYTCVEITKIGE